MSDVTTSVPAVAMVDEQSDDGPGSDVRIATRATGLLRTFNEAGVLIAADVHVASELGKLASSLHGALFEDELILLGVAFCVRAPRLGHTCVDLSTIRTTADADVDSPTDIASLPWPDPKAWIDRLKSSPMVGEGRPLHLEGSVLYLDRYWLDERRVAAELVKRAGHTTVDLDTSVLADGIDRLLGEDTDTLQKLASVSALLRRFAVIAGGPGTGKTTTVARILALIDEQALGGSNLPLIAIAAPTGKAATRLEQSVHQVAATLDTDERIKQHLSELSGSTIHRLLVNMPDSSTRFRHNQMNPLPHDVIVVDETSMVPLSMMARLVEAVKPDARLILVGDPEQLASVEAGTVLGDVVGPASHGLVMRAESSGLLEDITGVAPDASEPPVLESSGGPTPVGDGIVVLRTVHRFGAGIARLAGAVRTGDQSEVLDTISAGLDDVIWIPSDPGSSGAGSSLENLLDGSVVRTEAVTAGGTVLEAAEKGEAIRAIEALGSFRLLCAHRRGVAGATTWATRIEHWLASDVDGFMPIGSWYVGRPLLVTANDYALGLFNGDTGVVMRDGNGHTVAAFEQAAGKVLQVSPSRLEAIETMYAMTVHKSQGSQFDTVALILPEPTSPILTRELLYTAVTRAKKKVIIVGSAESVVTATDRPIARSSGLRRRLWGV
ncbi:MAG: exodeoxyribonuclease V subunit alpha [Acidimicrobiales bacterium]